VGLTLQSSNLFLLFSSLKRADRTHLYKADTVNELLCALTFLWRIEFEFQHQNNSISIDEMANAFALETEWKQFKTITKSLDQKSYITFSMR
jgi:hypothetical protein